MGSTKSITINHVKHGVTIHAIFHLGESGLLERVDFRTGKSGSSAHEEMGEVSDLINELIKDGKSLERIQKVLGARSVVSKIISEFMEVK